MDRNCFRFLLPGWRTLAAACAAALAGPTVGWSDSAATHTSVCAITARPADFDGRFVAIRATVLAGFEVFALRDPARADCGQIWMDIGEGTPATTVSLSELTPTLPRLPVRLRKDSSYSRFTNLLAAEMHPRQRGSMCIACKRFEITAVFTGRLDYAGERRGFGHLNAYATRLLLQSVAEVMSKDLSENYDPKEYSTDPVRFPAARIYGKVFGPDGRPVWGLNVMARSTEDVPLFMREFVEHTDERVDSKSKCLPAVTMSESTFSTRHRQSFRTHPRTTPGLQI